MRQRRTRIVKVETSLMTHHTTKGRVLLHYGIARTPPALAPDASPITSLAGVSGRAATPNRQCALTGPDFRQSRYFHPSIPRTRLGVLNLTLRSCACVGGRANPLVSWDLCPSLPVWELIVHHIIVQMSDCRACTKAADFPFAGIPAKVPAMF